jgi:[acyl-carrier-protein] S-malonyltransferase
VISGHVPAVKLSATLAKTKLGRNIKSIPLNVSAPFHCSLMSPIIEELAHEFSQIEKKKGPLKLPLISNVNAKVVCRVLFIISTITYNKINSIGIR